MRRLNCKTLIHGPEKSLNWMDLALGLYFDDPCLFLDMNYGSQKLELSKDELHLGQYSHECIDVYRNARLHKF
jgi:hypothetical protein